MTCQPGAMVVVDSPTALAFRKRFQESLRRKLYAPNLVKHFFISMLCMIVVLSSSAQPIDWPSLGFTQVTTNTFNAPIRLAHAGDGSGRLFVVEKAGRIWIVQSNNVVTPPFLDLSTRGDIHQFLSVAFPPGYATNSHFYVGYLRTNGAVCISRFQVTTNANVADTNSEQVLLQISEPFGEYSYDYVGQMAFGPDGFLYIGTGDGDDYSSPQNTSSLLGKLLRIDVESGASPYSVPTSNPFVGNTNYAPEIWALGLRNPLTFSFDRSTGNLYLGDSGNTIPQMNNVEEIDYQAAMAGGGQNYGWPIMDGTNVYEPPAGFTNYASLTGPVTSYAYTQGYSVRGGYVYRGPSEARMNGIYFFGDEYSGTIWGLAPMGTNWESFQLSQTSYGISTFGEDDSGELYLADYNSGKIYEIQDSDQVLAPMFSPASGTINSDLVTISCPTPGAIIYYTSNGLDPTEFDPIVASGGTIQVSSGMTNKTRAFRADLSPSAVVSAIFTLQVGTPAFNPAQGPITNGTTVSIVSSTPGAVIYYTLDGTTPTTNSPIYSNPLTINGGTTVSAMGVANGYLNSQIESVNYPLASVATPVFNPPQGLIPYGEGISISCATPGAVIYYTLDDSAPTTNSPVYSGPLVLSSRATLNAQAYRSDLNPSGLQSGYYTLFDFEHTVVTTLAGGTKSGFSNGYGAQATFSTPQGLCIDRSGNLYVADTGNNAIRKITPSGQVTTFAGTGVAGSQLGAATNAQFSSPTSVAIDGAGNIYVADPGNCNRICKITTNGVVTVLASWIQCSIGKTLWQIESDPAGNIYVGAGEGVDKVTPSGTVTHIAGALDIDTWDIECSPGWCYGVGVGIDASTNLYITTAAMVYELAPNGTLAPFASSTTTAFNTPNPGYSDGLRQFAQFGYPHFIIYAMPAYYNDASVDSATNVFMSDSTRIRKISASGWVSTMAGTANAGYQDGIGSVAEFNGVTGICTDKNGNIYVADSANNCIREISPDTYGIGIPDWWQLAHFGYIGIDPNADPDHDGMNNYEEFWSGTDPNNPNSSLRFTSISHQTNGEQLSWQGGTNMFQYLQRAQSLNGTNVWQVIFTNLPIATSTVGTFLDTSVSNTANYYRIQVDGP